MVKMKRETVIFMFSNIELTINALLRYFLDKTYSELFEKWSNPDFPFSDKVRILRFKEIITEQMASDLLILAKIRNEFSHNPFVKKNSFDPLTNLQITDREIKSVIQSNDPDIKSLPNDIAKFVMVAGVYNTILVRKCQELGILVVIGSMETHDFSEYMPKDKNQKVN